MRKTFYQLFLLEIAVLHTKVPPSRQTITANVRLRRSQDRVTKTKREKTNHSRRCHSKVAKWRYSCLELSIFYGKADGELPYPWSPRRVWPGGYQALRFRDCFFRGAEFDWSLLPRLVDVYRIKPFLLDNLDYLPHLYWSRRSSSKDGFKGPVVFHDSLRQDLKIAVMNHGF